ncbi:MAG: hypothetical protein M3036_02295 [Bifidobacteriales bacterium]|uniref:hypothetical protein n=1 Tax=unclassified Bifidobacterium TaxID=2608897 RepID=UPI00226BB5A4|nr:MULTISPECIES: hypothetical protein [unclassified Bifidobacterium]MCT6836470.1 hypothetical protein [Bifidobacteriales bacterium]MCX8648481.1 hypothetical protein [Bifidobacterium sp. B4107]MCX8652527.1 hypothetical protein [Bifidobacterium sp. B4111]MCX8659109.1 hypothetical protein [Bifidobacterium sp. B4114]
MTRATRQAKALQAIREGADDEQMRRQYGYPQAVIQAMRTTIAKEAAHQEGPEF